MRVVVCGSRDFDDVPTVAAVLDGLWDLAGKEPFVIIQGECPHGGADSLAKIWAEEWEVPCESFPAKTNTAPDFHARNRAMIDSGADLCVAFVNKPLSLSRGTASTVNYARSKGVKTIVVEVQ